MAVAVSAGSVAETTAAKAAKARDAARARAAAQVAFRRQVQAWIAEQCPGTRHWPMVTVDKYGTRHYSLPASGRPGPTRWLRAVVFRAAGPTWGAGSVWRWCRAMLVRGEEE